jgi:hypothetical protein
MNVGALNPTVKVPGMKSTVAELLSWAAGRWARRYARESDEAPLWNAARRHQVAALWPHLDPALNARVQETWAAAEAARQALAECEYQLEILPDYPPQSYAALAEWKAEIKAARLTLPELELAARDRACDYERAVAAAQQAVDRLVAPLRTAALAEQKKVAQATEQMNRDARQTVEQLAYIASELKAQIVRLG